METAHPTTPTPLSRALETIRHLKAQLDNQEASRSISRSIAIVGVGMRLPGEIDNLASYWQALAEGRDLVRSMPAARKAPFAAEWDTLPHKGGFLDEVTRFDAAFFGISPREARALDPQHRLLLEVAWEALENAALPPDRLPSARTGLYVGITGQDYRDWQVGAPDAYWATGNGHCFAAGRLAYAMGFTGPAIAVDTACSSGLVAVHLASQALRRGECDVAVAGGVNLVLSPRSTRLVMETRALAPDGLCKTFDARANGFTRGEGCGIVVLKRLDHALRDGDHVHAVIRGSAVNQDGRSSGFTAPNVLAQIALIEAALADAGLTPADIGLIEAHGTGTALGDPIEMEALVAALGQKNAGATLYVGSVKPNIGHLEAAAGVAGLLKAVACCAHRAIPALVHYRTLNPRIDLAGTGITLPTALVPWTAGDVGRFAGVSSFGLSGTNAHMVVGPSEPIGPSDSAAARPAQAASGFEITAATPDALRALAARFRQCLATLPGDQYGAFAYTATSGRARHAVRARIAATDKAAALVALDALARNAPCPAVRLGASEEPLDDLPRHVVVLPHYPWQREHYAPQAPVVESAPIGDAPTPAPTPAAVSTPPTTPAPTPAQPAHTRLDAVRGQVRRHVATTLGHHDVNAVPQDASFFDLGLDSMMAVDLARALGAALGIELSFTHVLAHPTVNDLAATIVAGLPATAVPANPAPAPGTGASEPARPAVRATTGTKPGPRVAFLFSCQGGQYFGMGRELYETEPVFRARIDACDRILAPQLGASLVDLMMHGDDPDAIHHTRVTQPAIVALQLALADLWTSWGVTASAVIGHSLGEVAAAIHAGVMDLASGLTLVAHRARLMASAPRGAMLAVTAPLARVTAWLAGTGIDVAAINGPEAIVVSGAHDAIEALTARLHAEGVTARALAVPLASHSRVMEPIVHSLHDAIAHLTFHAPALPIISNLTGRLAAAGDYDAHYWSRHVREPVRFHDGAQALRALDIDVCLEIGPDGTLINLATAAGLLPAGGGVASLRRGASDRASMLGAVQLLHAQGQQLAWREVLAASGPMRGPPSDRSAPTRPTRVKPPAIALLALPRRVSPAWSERRSPYPRALRDGLLSELRTALGSPGDLDRTKSLVELGGDSFTAIIFQNAIEQRYAIKLALAAIMAQLPLSALLDQLVVRIAGAAPGTHRSHERRVA
jgi:acyl transferase domain-containing protein